MSINYTQTIPRKAEPPDLKAMLAASPAYLSPALQAFMDSAAVDSARSET